MGSKWRKAKLALGLNTCLYVPQTRETGEESSPSSNDVAASRFSDAVSSSSMISPTGLGSDCRPTTPTPSSSGLRLPKTGTKSSKVWFVIFMIKTHLHVELLAIEIFAIYARLCKNCLILCNFFLLG